MPIGIYIALCVIYLIAMALLWREGFFRSKTDVVLPALIMLSIIVVRAFMFSHETDDYLNFLKPWVEFFRNNGGFKALGHPVGNYNPPYLYFLALFSYSGISELYLIKLLSLLFDVLLAWACMKLLSVCIKKRSALIACFFVILALPTVALNGAYWAQCDSIYVFFGVLSIYLALSGKPAGSMISLAASLAFKLQAIFIIPAFFVLLLASKIKLQHVFVFPAAYTVFLLPPVFFGRPLIEVLTLYFNQAGTVGAAMNYNSPSVFSMLGNLDSSIWSKPAVMAAFAFMLIILLFALLKREYLSDKMILGFTLLLAIGIPFLLPHMHDRYFYFADVMSVILAFTAPAFFPLPCFVQFASCLSYYAYLNMRYLLHPRTGGICMLAALILAFVYTFAIDKDVSLISRSKHT